MLSAFDKSEERGMHGEKWWKDWESSTEGAAGTASSLGEQTGDNVHTSKEPPEGTVVN